MSMRNTRKLCATLAIVLTTSTLACESTGGTTAGRTATSPISPTSTPDSPQASEITDIVRAEMTRLDLSAAVYGVWRGDEQIALGALGGSPLGVPATTAMQLRVGQPMEPMVSTVLWQLDRTGEVPLDRPISAWVPDFPRADEITPRMLANATSGIADYVTDPAFTERFYANPIHAWTASEILALAVARPPLFPPGTDWAYAHSDLVLLGVVMEKATNRSLGDLIDQHVLTPLDMHGSTVALTPQMAEPILHGYTNERKVFEDSTFWNPTAFLHSGNMNSTVTDIAKWVRALGTGTLLTEDRFTEMMAPSTAGLGPMTTDRYFAFGVVHLDRWLFMNPAFGGYHGVALYDPVTETTIVVYATLGPTSDANTDNAVPIGVKIGQSVVPDHPPSVP
ncbi:serine hydrolase domain-containing protein [Nocardia noduli]|uniref:serine hydrolase domain-containing protein n=1 Tax=Nocardia noduli TaxID=2815722 RepID=UPI001C22942B|nr:serine hydrolase domain-containing protein [Nocardia noduli]